MTLKKQVNGLRKAGGKSSLVAAHAESLIEKLALARDIDLKLIGRRTKHGEARIKKCMKFDLFDGYRLVGIRQGQDIVFLYIGTHDECDRWIKKNTGLRSIPCKEGLETIEGLMDGEPAGSGRDDELASASDEYLEKRFDEKDLREVFRGLTGGH